MLQLVNFRKQKQLMQTTTKTCLPRKSDELFPPHFTLISKRQKLLITSQKTKDISKIQMGKGNYHNKKKKKNLNNYTVRQSSGLKTVGTIAAVDLESASSPSVSTRLASAPDSAESSLESEQKNRRKKYGPLLFE